MRNLIISILFITISLVIFGIAGDIETHYYVKAEVIYNSPYEIVFEDENGEWWTWEIDGAQAEIGDKCRLKMFTKNTENNIYDDEIEKILWD